MKTLTRYAVASLTAVSGLLLASSPARAADSTRGPFYVQGAPIGFATYAVADTCYHNSIIGADICSGGGSFYAYRAAVEFGYHFSGRGDGFVLGVRQSFWLSGGSAGVSQARLGWDIAIPIKDFELTIAPYGVAGIAYGFSGGSPSFAFGVGVEGKFFFMKPDSSAKGLYAFAQPVELGGVAAGGLSGFVYTAGAGIGYAF